MADGLKTGITNGLNNGIKSGNGMANPRRGLVGGQWRNVPNRDKMLNPANLDGTKKPLVYGIADYYTISGGNTTVLNDIANTGNTWISNASVTNRPIAYENTLNGKTILKYDGSSSVMLANSAPSSTARSAYTIMAMVKLNTTPGLTAFDTGQITAGAILVSTPSNSASACQLRSRFYSSTSTGTTYTSDVGPTNSSSTANTPNEFKDYMLVTCKYRLNRPAGVGSEQHMFINGRFHQILLGTDSFSPTINSTSTMPEMGIGNNPISQNSFAQGFEMGMGLILPYWLEYAEQVKIENYFRWYYGRPF